MYLCILTPVVTTPEIATSRWCKLITAREGRAQGEERNNEDTISQMKKHSDIIVLTRTIQHYATLPQWYTTPAHTPNTYINDAQHHHNPPLYTTGDTQHTHKPTTAHASAYNSVTTQRRTRSVIVLYYDTLPHHHQWYTSSTHTINTYVSDPHYHHTTLLHIPVIHSTPHTTTTQQYYTSQSCTTPNTPPPHTPTHIIVQPTSIMLHQW